LPKYLFQVNYPGDSLKGILAKGGSVRKTAAQAAAKLLGGRVESFHFAFGATDAFVIADLPSNTAAAALAMSVSAGGGATVVTTVLLTPDEIDNAAGARVRFRPEGF